MTAFSRAARESLHALNPLGWSRDAKEAILFTAVVCSIVFVGATIVAALWALGGWWIAAALGALALTILATIYCLIFITKYDGGR